MVRAIFFDAFKRKWRLSMSIISPNFFGGISSDKMVPHQPSLKAVETSRKFLSGEPVRGTNPEVFLYRIRYDEANDRYAFAAIFYNCFEVYSFSSREFSEMGRTAGLVG
jgi:hypothetical protein